MPADADMVSLLLLPLLWGGSLQEDWGYQLRVQDTVTVQEGLCVHVPCSFSYPWSSWSTHERPYVYWFRSGDSSHNSQLVATNDPTKTVKTEFRDRFNVVRKPQENDCSLRIREARRSDQGLYKFQIGKDYVRYAYKDKQLNLKVAGMAGAPGELWDVETPLLEQQQDTGTFPAPGLGAGMVGRDMGAWGQLVS